MKKGCTPACKLMNDSFVVMAVSQEAETEKVILSLEKPLEFLAEMEGIVQHLRKLVSLLLVEGIGMGNKNWGLGRKFGCKC